MKASRRSYSRKPPSPRTTAGRATRARARPGGKPRTASSGAATGSAGARRRRRAHLTTRAAILAVVVCAIVLSVAYPVREYVAQRREIAALRAEAQERQERIAALSARKQKLNDPDYVKRQARSRLHYCMPEETCYVVADPDGGDGGTAAGGSSRSSDRPWYVTLWESVETADEGARAQ